jgi:hypothetical protein
MSKRPTDDSVGMVNLEWTILAATTRGDDTLDLHRFHSYLRDGAQVSPVNNTVPNAVVRNTYLKVMQCPSTPNPHAKDPQNYAATGSYPAYTGVTQAEGDYAVRDKTIRIWNVDLRQEWELPAAHRGAVLSLAFAPDGRTLVTGSQDRLVKLWSTDLDGPEFLRPLSGLGRQPSAVTSLRDAATPAAALQLAETVEALLRPLTEEDRPIVALALEGYPVVEISARTRRTERTVYRVLTRVRLRLEQGLADET